MGRGTLGTGMMAPLAMANNFNGPYYAGPSGAAMGALMAAQSIGDGFRDWGASKGRQQDEARVQEERDRVRMDELNQRQAVASAINPMQAAQSSGMGNRDMSRRMALPDASTQMGVYKLVQDRQEQAKAEDYAKKKAFAQSWAARGGYRSDPTGEKFMAQVGYNPFEYEVGSIIATAEEKEANRQWQTQMKQDGYAQAQTLAQIAASNRGGGGGATAKAPSGYRTVIDENGEQRLEFVPGGPADPANKSELRSIPTAAVASMTGNFGTLNRIDESLAETEKSPKATSYLKGTINEYAPNLINRMDPDGASARAALGDLGSTIIHDRSGAAVTASEYPRLRPFIPTAYDDADTVKMKLKRFREVVAEETRLYADNFSQDMGYKRPESWNRYLDAAPATQPQQGEQSASGISERAQAIINRARGGK